MKVTKMFSVLVLLASIFFFACSSEEKTDTPPDEVKSITLTANNSGVLVGTKITFKVLTDKEENVSSSAEILVNGQKISGTTYTPSAKGELTVVAKYKGLESNEVKVTVVTQEDEIKSIVVSATPATVEASQKITFKVQSDNGINVTSKSTITVNGTEISGATYTPTAAGDLKVKAKFNSIESEEITIAVEEKGARFQKYVVVEDFTGTWCGWCPRVSRALELVEEQTNYAITVAAHIGDNMQNDVAKSLKNLMGVSSYPTAYIDRKGLWSSPQTSSISQVTNIPNEDATVGVAMETSLVNNEISIKAKVKFGINYSNDLRLVVFVLEDGIKENQANYTSYYNGADPIVGFTHNHVLRGALTDVKGSVIPKENATKNNTYEVEVKGNVPTTVADTSKMNIVVMVVENSGKKVINARYAHIGDTKEFEEK